MIDSWVLLGVVPVDDFLGDLLLKSWTWPGYIHTGLDSEQNNASLNWPAAMSPTSDPATFTQFGIENKRLGM